MARRTAVPTIAPTSRWVASAALLASLLFVGIIVFPDEKIARFKWQFAQMGVLLVSAVVMLRGAVAGKLGRGDAAASIAAVVLAAVNASLVALAADRALAVSEASRIGVAALSFLAFSHMSLDDRWLRRVLVTWTVAATFMAIFGLLQHAGGIGRIIVPRVERVTGSFGNPIFFAAFLVTSLFVGLAARKLVNGGAATAAILTGLVVQAGALIFTQTRSALLALAVSAGAFVFLGRRDRRTVLAGSAVVAACAVALILLAGRDQAHVLIWRDTLRLWLTSPLAGVGLGAFHIHFPDIAGADLKAKWPAGQFIVNFAHNEYLQSLAEGGVPGFLSFVALPITAILAVRRRASDTVALLLGAAGLAGYVQNAASVDFRFGVSQVLSCACLGLAVSRSRSPGDDLEIPFAARGPLFVCAVFFAPLLSYLSWASFSARRQAAVAPGFFEQRMKDPERVIAEREALADRSVAEMEALAYVYAKEMKRADGTLNAEMVEKAMAAFARVIEVDPSRASAHNNLGNVLFTVGRTADAARAWSRAAELDPSFVDPRLNLGKTAYVRGDLKAAARHFQDVLRIDPGNAEASLYLRRMVE